MKDIIIETDKGDIEFVRSNQQLKIRNSIVPETKLVRLVDELDLWVELGGTLEENNGS